MERIANLSGVVTGFSVTESYIDCICGKELIKIENAPEILFAKRKFLRKKVSQEI